MKKAFTLAEVIFCLIIAAILIAVTFITTKPKQYLDQKSIKTKYATVYDALNLATYDLIGKDETNPFIITAEDQATGNTDPYQKLCKGLAAYINTDSVSCKIPALSNNVAYLKHEDIDFTKLTPNLESLTGVKFYISQIIKDNKLPAISRSYYDAGNPNFTLEFFMVYVDLNGTEYQNRPHTIKVDPTGKKMPDVFAFAIIPTGEAIPMGAAEYDNKFFSTRISYIENKAKYYSPYYSYRQAKHMAWGWYSPSAGNIQFRKTISFTYNDYIKEILKRNGTQLYDFNKENIYPETYDEELFPKCNPPAGTLLSRFDMCSIVVDTPKFGASH